MSKINVNEEHIIAWRRHLHRHPELSFQEYETAEYIYSVLNTFPNLEVFKPTETSVIAIMDTGKPGKTIALRADIDALPLLEESGVDFPSENPGVMHACGHDAHPAMLLGAIEVLTQLKSELTGKIKFIFQHAEEKAPGGAQELVDLGHLKDVDMIFGQHVSNGIEVGKIGVHAGPANAAADEFHLTIKGRGGHAAAPEFAIDPLLVGAEIIIALYHIPLKNVNAFESIIVTVGEMSAGTASNVIPDTAFLQGTVRTHSEAVRDIAEERIRSIIEHISAMHGTTYELNYERNTGVVMNDAKAAAIAEKAAAKIVGAENVYDDKARMGAEDFAAYTSVVPGVFCRLGTGFGALAHNPKFLLDESAFKIGASFFVQIILDTLGS